MRKMKIGKLIFLYSLAVLPLLSMAMVNIAIFFFIIVGVWSYKNNSVLVIGKGERLKSIFWLSIPLIMYVLCLPWSSDIQNGFSFIERSYVFLVFPLIIFYGQSYHESRIKRFIHIYILASVTFSILILLFLIYKIVVGEILLNSLDYFSVVNLRAVLDKVPLIHEHPIYISLILGLALILLYYNKFKIRGLNIGIVSTITPTLLLASSRGPLLALIIVFCCIIIQTNTNRLKAILLLVLFFISIIGFVYISPLNSRIKEITTNNYFYPEGVHHNSFNIRNGTYKCCYEISKEVPLYGFGTGSVQGLLNTCYENYFDTDVYKNKNYNTHNQFFHFYITFGLLGFIIIIYSYVIFFKRALLVEDYAYFYFLIFFLICFLTENIINRNTGIVLFAIFNSLFYYRTYLKNDYS